MLRLLALAAVLLLANTAPAAFVVLDSLNNPNPETFFSIGSGSLTLPPVITGHGSTRTTSLNVNTGFGGNSISGSVGFNTFVNDGIFAFNSNTFSRSSGTLLYDNFTGTAGNFYAAGLPEFLYLNFLNIDPGVDVSTNSPALNMPADLAISTTGGTITGSLLLASSPVPITYQIPINALGGFGDLSQVLSISITFNSGPNQRQATDFVMTGFVLETTAVPLPPTVLLALAGLPLIARLRRRS